MTFRMRSGRLFTLACCILYAGCFYAQKSGTESQLETGLRLIGHRVLLQANDSTSRVLPILKQGDQYRIQFESEFSFIPEQLVSTIDAAVQESKIATIYVVEVEDCETGNVVYSFKMDDTAQSDIVPCGSRVQAKGCYNLIFYNLDGPKAIPTTESSKGSSVASINSSLVLTTLLVLIGMMLFVLWRRTGTQDPNLIALGNYQFDTRNIVLINGEDRVPLTSKEADLLMILHNAANTTVPKEELLHKVWGDEGDYIGRTLDVFISKLRKKLEADPNLKIINARGIGYKLVKNS